MVIALAGRRIERTGAETLRFPAANVAVVLLGFAAYLWSERHKPSSALRPVVLTCWR